MLRPEGYLIVSCTNKFVMDRLSEQESPSQPRAHIGRYFDTKTIRALLQRRFRLLKLKPLFRWTRWDSRIINSQKLNSLLAAATSRDYLEGLKNARDSAIKSSFWRRNVGRKIGILSPSVLEIWGRSYSGSAYREIRSRYPHAEIYGLTVNPDDTRNGTE